MVRPSNIVSNDLRSFLRPACGQMAGLRRAGATLLAALIGLCRFADAQAVGDVEFNDPLISSGLVLYSPILTTMATTAPFMWTSAAIEGRDEKVLMQARDDAALYVASGGREQGAYLTAALALLRERGATQGDQVLAEWILMVPALNPAPASTPPRP